MEVTTTGRYRVLESPRERPELLLVDRSPATTEDDAADEDAYAPTYVRADGYEGDLADAVAALEAGNVVDATLRWNDGEATFTAVDVLRRTRLSFADGVTGMFEAAQETWRAAEAEGEAMNSRVTHSTDGDPNGALYVFAEQPGERDLFSEFRNGALPLEPLLDRVNEDRDDDDARDVFVLRPADRSFVVVYIVFERDGVLARTVRDTYEFSD